MALPETPFEKRAKFEIIDGGLSQQENKPAYQTQPKSDNVYEGSLRLLAKDLEEFLTTHA